MLINTTTTLRERILKTFPERQFIHRTSGRVNYFVLTTRAQLFLSSIIIAVLMWSMISALSFLWGKNPLLSSAQELRVKKEEFSRHLIDLDAQVTDAQYLLGLQQKEFELAAENFEQKHNTIVSMLTQGGIANDETQLPSSIYAQSTIIMSPYVIDVLPRLARADFTTIKPMQTGTHLDSSLTHIEIEQNSILVSGESKIQNRIENNRAILMATGIPFGDILKNGAHGVGGPFISVKENGDVKNTDLTQLPGSFLPRLESINARSVEIAALDKALTSVPFSVPIDAEHYLTSTFGRRKDPFTKRPTQHNGMDMASYHLAPIVATADGKISFVGRRAGYGRVVEITHGHGFKTRYAHLAKTYVKRGQSVGKGEKIAGMGSSGRSTSTHLHYEIYFENRVQNPALFMKAGQYVQ